MIRTLAVSFLGMVVLVFSGSVPTAHGAHRLPPRPQLDYATYLPARHASANGLVVAPNGSALIGGDRDGRDGFIMRINPTGTAVSLDITLHGGIVNALALGSSGTIYATGVTTASGFAVGEGHSSCRAGSVFIVRLDHTGHALYSVCLGGHGDSGGNAIAVDTAGNAVVTGQTYAPDFPTYHALQPHYGIPHMTTYQTSDAFVVKLDPDGVVLYSTYLGGRGDDEGHGVVLDQRGNAYISGWTASADFPLWPRRPHHRGRCEGASPFLAVIKRTGSRLLASTCFASRDYESYAGPIVRDHAGFLYIGGHGSDDTGVGFAFKVDPSGQRVLRHYRVAGGVQSMALDASDNLLLSGATSSLALPLLHPLQVPRRHTFCGQEDATHICSDAFLLAFNPHGRQVLGTYLGGWGDDVARALTVGPRGNVLLAGSTASRHFPLRHPLQTFNPGVDDTYHGGPDSGWVARINLVAPLRR